MERTFQNFSQKLSTRLKKKIQGQRIFTTEDSIRYTFFSTLLDLNIPPENIILEHPHPTILGAKIDTWVEDFFGRSAIFEFKYDRNNSTHNKNRTGQAGGLFKDITRLTLWDDKNTKRFLVYVTDYEMKNYLRNERNGLRDFFALPLNNELIINEPYFAQRSMHFKRRIGDVVPCKINCRYSDSLDDDNELRIYEVLA